MTLHPSLKIVFSITILFTPLFALAAGLVPCGGPHPEPACNFDFFIVMIQGIINWLLIIAAPIAALLFAYAGYLYMSAAGDTGKISAAHKIFWTAFVGIVIALAAWLIVDTLIDVLLKDRPPFIGN